VWRRAVRVLEPWLRPEAATVTAGFTVSAPELGERWTIVVDRGRLLVNPEPPRPAPDVVTDDLFSFTLAFPYRRRSLTEPVLVRVAELFGPI
jgi:hypothetical protein